MSDIYFQEDNGEFVGDMPIMKWDPGYIPDDNQKKVARAINNGYNVLYTAPTGSGKTFGAIHAIAKHKANDRNEDSNKFSQVIYCSPIKALSNQKYKEFSEIFDDVGVLTGDIKVNPTGSIIIMTAEILRNSISNTNDVEDSYEFKFNTNDVKAVIFDEIHYINNDERGKVWEEILTNLNKDIQIVMLSATIGGADNLARWLGNLKMKKCVLISTNFRPVPLNHYLYDYPEEVIGKNPLKCISKSSTNSVNRWVEGSWSSVFSNIEKYMKKNNGRYRNQNTVLYECIEYCKINEMLPVNIFILNREHLEKTANNLSLSFVDKDDIKEINRVWNENLLKYRDIYKDSDQWNNVYALVNKGIGIHHSGMIPILKEIVEILYESKLVKILFATETFAMGVNMPTRTVIFQRVSKFDGKGKRALRPDEYIQMAGRAGRRGKDSCGSVIILPDMDMKLENDAKGMVKSQPQILKSKLHIDYTFVLKLMTKMHESDNKDVFKYIGSNISKTLFSIEENKISNGLKRSNIESLENKKIELSKFNNDISLLLKNNSFDESEYSELTSIVNEILKIYKDKEYQLSLGFTIRANEAKRQEKKIVKIKEDINKKTGVSKEKIDDFINSFQKVNNLEKEINKLENIVELESGCESNFRMQISLILQYLKKFMMININENDEYILTPLGRIVSEVNECNPLLMGYIINEGLFDDLEFHEIVSILSVFISENHDDSPFIGELDKGEKVSSVLYSIAEFIDELKMEESKMINDLPYSLKSDWNFSLSNFQFIYEWSKGDCTWGSIKTEYHKLFSFEGNFCRNILRIVNLLRNIEAIAVMSNKSNLVKKINGYYDRLVRDIVTTDSLYI